MLELNKQTVVELTSTGPKLGRYRFRVQEIETGHGLEYFVSYKEGWFGERKWVVETRPVARFHDAGTANDAAFASLEDAMRALDWAREQVATILKLRRVHSGRLKTIIGDR